MSISTVRERRGQEGRRILHSAMCGKTVGGDAEVSWCCGSSGMFVQCSSRAHANGIARFSIYGQESNYTTWMNLIRSIEGQIAHGDSFHNDRHPDLKADFILANPPFNVSDWGGERLTEDKRWQYGAPPKGNANFAWVQHIAHLAPADRRHNGSMSSSQSGEGEIRKD